MMGTPSSSELSLECKPYMGSSYSMLLKSFGDHQTGGGGGGGHDINLEEFLTCLEEERQKIEAFKRELPLCMQLLTNAMEASKQQLQSYKQVQNQRHDEGSSVVLEEFIPIKNINDSTSGSTHESMMMINSCHDKKNWMTSAQLWNNGNIIANQTSPKESLDIHDHNLNDNIGFHVTPKQGIIKGSAGSNFLPFSKPDPTPNLQGLPELALVTTSAVEILEQDHQQRSINVNINVQDQAPAPANGPGSSTAASATNQQTNRKARRCWSPDLHRRFVNALQMLGGSQVATPKQIRELMKVDGLTNDEVKSHLQKYRLHTRRPSPSPSPQAAGGGPIVVLGGIWVPPEYAAAHGGATHAIYSAHSSGHYCGPPMPQEFYTAAGTHPPAAQVSAVSGHHHHHQQPTLVHHHGQVQVYKALSSTHNSPDSDVRSESIEDGKSESSSGGDEGGGRGGERKGLAALREEGEESIGSEITLKF